MTGTLLCGHCANGTPPRVSIPLTKDQLAAMRHIIYSQANKVFRFKMTPQGLRNLGKITEVYLQAQLDRQFRRWILSPAAADYPLAAAIVAKATDNRDTGT